MKKNLAKKFLLLGLIAFAIILFGCPNSDKSDVNSGSTGGGYVNSIMLDPRNVTLYTLEGDTSKEAVINALIAPFNAEQGVTWSITSGDEFITIQTLSDSSAKIIAKDLADADEGSAVVTATSVGLRSNGTPATAIVNVTILLERDPEPVVWTFTPLAAPETWVGGSSVVSGGYAPDSLFGNGLWLLSGTGTQSLTTDPPGNGVNMSFTDNYLRINHTEATWGRIVGYKGPFTIKINYTGSGTSVGDRRPAVRIITEDPEEPNVDYNISQPLLSFVHNYDSGELVVLYEGTDRPEILLKAGGQQIRVTRIELIPWLENFVTSVTLNVNERLMGVGDTYTLVETVLPSYAVQGVTWSSSDDTVATVDENGLVTAIGAGFTTITATTVGVTNTGLELTAECEVEVRSDLTLVESVSINKAATSIEVGATETLVATTTPAAPTVPGVTWKTSNPAIATVSASGVVTAIATGTVNITATTNSLTIDDVHATDTCEVTVTYTGPRRTIMWDFNYAEANYPVPVMHLATHAERANAWIAARNANPVDFGNGLIFVAGQNTTLDEGSQGRPAIPGDFTDYVTNELFTPGQTRIDANQRWANINGVQGPYKLLILYSGTGGGMRVPVVEINGVVYNRNGELSNNDTGLNANVLEVVYLGADSPEIRMQNPTGGIRLFNIVIVPLVFDPATSLTITAANDATTVEVDRTLQLSANVLPVTADPRVNWSSSNEAFATVNETGLVTGIAVGNVVITATSVGTSSVSNTYNIGVTAATSVSLTWPTTPANVTKLGGTVTVGAATAVPGTEITINTVPFLGFKVSEYSVIGESDTVVDVDANGKFTVPNEDVTINVTFDLKMAKRYFIFTIGHMLQLQGISG